MRTDKLAKTLKRNGLMEPLMYLYPNALCNECSL